MGKNEKNGQTRGRKEKNKAEIEKGKEETKKRKGRKKRKKQPNEQQGTTMKQRKNKGAWRSEKDENTW